MDPEIRRLILALLVATGVFFAYRLTVAYLFPLPPAPPAQTQPANPADQQAGDSATPGAAPAATRPASSPASGPTTTSSTLSAVGTRPAPYVVSVAELPPPVKLGGRAGDALEITLGSPGASVESMALVTRLKNGRFEHRRSIRSEDPYVVVEPVSDGLGDWRSFETSQVRVSELGGAAIEMRTAHWQLDEATAERAVYSTTLRDAEDRDVLRFRKTYAMRDGKPVFTLTLDVENVSGQPLTVSVDQDGPVGIPEEDPVRDMRFLLSAQFDKATGAAHLNRGHMRSQIVSAIQKGEPLKLIVPDKGPLAWVALINKYFGVFTRPLPPEGQKSADFVVAGTAQVGDAKTTVNHGDLIARLATAPTPIAPGGSARFAFEIYAGAMNATYLASVDPAYADERGLDYEVAPSALQSCSCTFVWLQNFMAWLLTTVHYVVRNYGIAILILVLIVRGLLHPLSVFQQKSMYRMQEAMGRLQPRLDDLKVRYANDKVKLNQETMKLFAEENVNPAGSMVAMIPLFIQMPILVALWTTLNTDVHLRHAPFDGWWIKDLSAPDAFIQFDSPIDVPILSALPLIGRAFVNIHSVNLLPILMGVSMWLQQKYMPKPHLKAKLEAAKKQPAGQRPAGGGMTAEEQMRQQQIMAYVMSILFPLMFYSTPSGLSLYWMMTNIFGIGESLIIQRQIDRERKRKELLGPQPVKPKKPGLLSGFLKHIASQAEELQRKADELSKNEDPRKRDKK